MKKEKEEIADKNKKFCELISREGEQELIKETWSEIFMGELKIVPGSLLRGGIKIQKRKESRALLPRSHLLDL